MLRHFPLVLSLFIVGCGAAQSKDHCAKGEKSLAENDLDLALSCFNEAIRADPSNARAFEKRAETHFDQKQWPKCIADASEAIRLSPEFVDAYVIRARAYTMGDGSEGKALKDIEKAIALDPSQPKPYYVRAVLCSLVNDRKGMYADLGKAIKLDPKYAAAFEYRAGKYFEDKEYESAIADASKAISIDSMRGKAYAWRGLSLRATGKNAEAAPDLKKARSLSSEARAAIDRETGTE
jgi:tetratricopeptide (TPR) repeat protein